MLINRTPTQLSDIRIRRHKNEVHIRIPSHQQSGGKPLAETDLFALFDTFNAQQNSRVTYEFVPNQTDISGDGNSPQSPTLTQRTTLTVCKHSIEITQGHANQKDFREVYIGHPGETPAGKEPNPFYIVLKKYGRLQKGFNLEEFLNSILTAKSNGTLKPRGLQTA